MPDYFDRPFDSMTKKKVTLQDVADALGISRNTVSKAINNTGSVAEETRNKIFQTAASMGYKQFAMLPQFSEARQVAPTVVPTTPDGPNEIALFTYSFMNRSHFGSTLLDSFQQEIDKCGYKLSIYMVRSTEIEQLTFPSNFNREHTAGILCLELFSEEYSRFLCQQSIPLLFVDTVVNHMGLNLNSDLLYMENKTSTYLMLKSIIDRGYTKLSFVGDHMHCQSFHERWISFCQVLNDHQLPADMANSILEDDNQPYNDVNWLADRIRALPVFPDVFFCANDYVAVAMLKALKSMNLVIPRDVLVCGFDNSPESKVVEPSLTTVCIHSTSMGYTAAEILLSRINHPDRPYRRTYVNTDIIYRDSTGSLIK